MLSITRTILGAVPSSVSLLRLQNACTGAPIPLTPPLPQPFLSAGGGNWSFSFPQSAAGIIYSYSYRITWPDGSFSPGSGLLPGTQPAAGRYATQADLENLFGKQNIALWADLDNTPNLSTAIQRIALALSYADATIDNALRGGAYAVPLVLFSASSTLAFWASVLAGLWLYHNRGQRDDDKDGNRYRAMRADVMTQLRQCKTGLTIHLDAAPAQLSSPQTPVVIR